MLLRHSAQYLLASGLPGLVNFLAIALYSRLLSPDEYGRYALVIAGIGLINVVFFQWLRLALSRFLPAHLENPKLLLSTILAGFSAMVLLTGGIGLLLSYLWPDQTWKWLMLLAVPLLWTQAFFEISLSLNAVKLLPQRYGLINGVKAISALAIGAVLIVWGLGPYGPLIGLLLGMLLSIALWGRTEWNGLSHRISKPLLGEILRYGLPLTATFALSFVMSSSDRFLLAWLLGEGQAGIYSASYDLGQQTLTMLMTIVNLAAYPLAVRALEQKGMDAAQEQLRHNATLLLAIALPAAVGIVVLAPNVSEVLLGISFREDATRILPWVALSILLAGVRAYHFDMAFQLGKYTMGQVWVTATSAILNVFLNFWWIPQFGLIGSAYATFASCLLALLMSAALGRKVFVVPFPCYEGLKIAFSSLLMGFLLCFTLTHQGLYALIVQVVLGCASYSAMAFLLDIGRCRTKLLQRFI